MPVSIQSFDPAPNGTCRVCRGPLDAVTWLCTRCGAAHGERNRCPHCRSIARTTPHPTLLHRCSVCGKPRIPPGSDASGETAAQLRSAGQAHRVGTAVKYAGHAALAVSLAYLALASIILLILMPGAWVTGISLGIGFLMLVFWFFLRGQGNRALAERDRALERAYSQAILATLRLDSVERSAEEIAQLVHLPLERTESLLTSLNAHDRMTSRVTDEGDLLFGAAEPARLRVDAGPNVLPEEVVEAEFDEALEKSRSAQRQP
ncbi:MAG TPA: hypothetical protein VKP30_16450 [Polyangiaceae bacterium]|nr:hypothetical protein [Polyangiaceae bacterium]